MNLNHVALSVPDLDAACKFYQSVFGFRKIRSDKVHDRKVSPRGPIFRIYGETLKEVKVAYLSSGNGVGFELFQFVDPPYQPPESLASSMPLNYTRGGFYHVGVTKPRSQEREATHSEHASDNLTISRTSACLPRAELARSDNYTI